MFEQLSHRELVQLMELANRCLTATTPDELDAIASSIGDVERGILVAIAPHLQAAQRRILAARPADHTRCELSAREREVLSWAQHGKTYWEIGSILGITERTVKFHVARIKTKLDVVSTAHAIAKAMRSGLIA